MLDRLQRANLSQFLDNGAAGDLAGDVARRWPSCDRALIRQRYDRIAGFIPLFDCTFPPGLRKRAVDRLKLRSGNRVLDVGCGTGRNFSFLREAVGSGGRIYGVDLSAGMLREARKRCRSKHLTNVVLIESDAADYAAPDPLDGALFSFSYNTMPHHRAVLRRVWNQLRPGGRLVIVDAKLPPGTFGMLILPFAFWLMKRTLLGNPLVRPWEHHAALVDDFKMEEFRFASYYVCSGSKPA